MPYKQGMRKDPLTGKVELVTTAEPDLSAGSCPNWLRDDEEWAQSSRVKDIRLAQGAGNAGSSMPSWASDPVRPAVDCWDRGGISLRHEEPSMTAVQTRPGRQGARVVHVDDPAATNAGGTQPLLEVRAHGGATPSLHKIDGSPVRLVEYGGTKYLDLSHGIGQTPRWVVYTGPAEPRHERSAVRTGQGYDTSLHGSYEPNTGRAIDPATGRPAGSMQMIRPGQWRQAPGW